MAVTRSQLSNAWRLFAKAGHTKWETSVFQAFPIAIEPCSPASRWPQIGLSTALLTVANYGGGDFRYGTIATNTGFDLPYAVVTWWPRTGLTAKSSSFCRVSRLQREWRWGVLRRRGSKIERASRLARNFVVPNRSFLAFFLTRSIAARYASFP